MEEKYKLLSAAKSIGKLYLEYKTRRERLKSIYDRQPKKWQKSISDTLKELSTEMQSFLIACSK